MSAHTPTLWRVAEEIAKEGIWIEAPNAESGEADEICHCSEATVTHEECLANAEHIVKCVNHFNDMVKALQFYAQADLWNYKAVEGGGPPIRVAGVDCSELARIILRRAGIEPI